MSKKIASKYPYTVLGGSAPEQRSTLAGACMAIHALTAQGVKQITLEIDYECQKDDTSTESNMNSPPEEKTTQSRGI